MNGFPVRKLIAEDTTRSIIRCAVEVHRQLGPGLLESVYRTCLAREMRDTGLAVQEELRIDIDYKGLRIENAYRADLAVNGEVLLELKAVETILPIHRAQLLTYLKMSSLHVGLLFNFNVPLLMRGGFYRMAV
jgi:GxxExxY protein